MNPPPAAGSLTIKNYALKKLFMIFYEKQGVAGCIHFSDVGNTKLIQIKMIFRQDQNLYWQEAPPLRPRVLYKCTRGKYDIKLVPRRAVSKCSNPWRLVCNQNGRLARLPKGTLEKGTYIGQLLFPLQNLAFVKIRFSWHRRAGMDEYWRKWR